ncbi:MULTISPECIES: hypothetical protein [Leifsonia]|uniref:DUF2306 domain-containing protein n=2 Tax=Leifsonia TaxID=110932 RepID=A0A7W4UW06_LEIAQ|nr:MULTISPECIES: hypothetical protein [Leifsonia]MBB2967245.1 hypothetical protein [Leifsonia aquatica]MBO1741906.1 hypothetical protein [Leifsonia sp. TF02-11]NYJ21750.1 membrane protein implicated in regulation of membrane protease activity [Leifsonia shinshuensis]QIZ97379.1 DUF2306 domain-containing protein [Leifsonia sp. PS1209]
MRTEPLLGLDVASLSAVFLALLGIHVAAALVAIASGLVAMFSRKGSGRHVVSGRFYFGAILIVFASACAMSAFRWPADLPLVAAGAVAAVAASFGFIYRRLHRPGNAPHIIAMGVSYVAMLTAFYVDNGPQLPLWRLLPSWLFWFLPAIVGAPLIIRAVLKHRHLSSDSDNPSIRNPA